MSSIDPSSSSRDDFFKPPHDLSDDPISKHEGELPNGGIGSSKGKEAEKASSHIKFLQKASVGEELSENVEATLSFIGEVDSMLGLGGEHLKHTGEVADKSVSSISTILLIYEVVKYRELVTEIESVTKELESKKSSLKNKVQLLSNPNNLSAEEESKLQSEITDLTPEVVELKEKITHLEKEKTHQVASAAAKILLQGMEISKGILSYASTSHSTSAAASALSTAAGSLGIAGGVLGGTLSAYMVKKGFDRSKALASRIEHIKVKRDEFNSILENREKPLPLEERTSRETLVKTYDYSLKVLESQAEANLRNTAKNALSTGGSTASVTAGAALIASAPVTAGASLAVAASASFFCLAFAGGQTAHENRHNLHRLDERFSAGSQILLLQGKIYLNEREVNEKQEEVSKIAIQVSERQDELMNLESINQEGELEGESALEDPTKNDPKIKTLKEEQEKLVEEMLLLNTARGILEDKVSVLKAEKALVNDEVEMHGRANTMDISVDELSNYTDLLTDLTEGENSNRLLLITELLKEGISPNLIKKDPVEATLQFVTNIAL